MDSIPNNAVPAGNFFPASMNPQYSFIQLVLNGKLFAIFNSSIQTALSIIIDLEGYTVIALKPLSSQADIDINARQIILLNDLTSTDGKVSVVAKERCILFGNCIHSKLPSQLTGSLTKVPINQHIVEFIEKINKEFDLAFSEHNAREIVNAVLAISELVFNGTNPGLFALCNGRQEKRE